MADALADVLTDFLWEHCPYRHTQKTKEQLRNEIALHLEYKTIVYLEDEKGIVAVCRFNITDSVEANIYDAAVRPDRRNKDMLRRLLELGLRLYPNIKQLRFESAYRDRSFVTPIGSIVKKESKNVKV